MNARITRIDSIFHPRSIAFIGATDSIGKWGNVIFENILKGGWKGTLYPVNPVKDSVCGIKTYKSVKDIPAEIDLAFFTIPARQLPDAIDDCVSKNVKAGVIITAGFKETGTDGAELEKLIIKKAQEGGMVLAGPNGQGTCCTNSELYSWLPTFFPRKGTVGVVSQSGNIMSVSIGCVVESGVGISKGVSSGNEGDLTSIDYFDYYASDPEVDVIMAYLEGIKHGRDFFDRAKKIAMQKPIVVLKSARSAGGAKAAGSHTGSMAVSDDLLSSAFRQTGITRARTVKELGSLAASFVNRPLPKGNRVGIITGGGGFGVLATDLIADEGLTMAEFSKDTIDRLAKVFPDFWVPGNPVDTVAGMDYIVIETLLSSNEIDMLLIIWQGAPSTHKGVKIPDTYYVNESMKKKHTTMRTQWNDICSRFYDLSMKYGIPIFPIVEMPEIGDVDATLFQGEKPVSFYKDVDSACRAMGAMTKYAEFLRKNR